MQTTESHTRQALHPVAASLLHSSVRLTCLTSRGYTALVKARIKEDLLLDGTHPAGVFTDKQLHCHTTLPVAGSAVFGAHHRET